MVQEGISYVAQPVFHDAVVCQYRLTADIGRGGNERGAVVVDQQVMLVAPGLDEIGVMLPYSPLHHLLLNDYGAPLIATSANVSGEPVLTENSSVEDRLDHVADAFLHHDRPIERPADDPVYRVIGNRPRLLRAGRGDTPLELELPFSLIAPLIAVGELASISERRTDRLLDPARSQGLPAFLSPNPGLNSGYMISQYVQAALVAENKVLAHPASVESIPTSGRQEDHVSMGWGAGRKLFDVLNNVRRVLAIEILCAVQGIDYRKPLAPARGTRRVVDLVRSHVPPLDADRPLSEEVETISDLIIEGSISDLV